MGGQISAAVASCRPLSLRSGTNKYTDILVNLKVLQCLNSGYWILCKGCKEGVRAVTTTTPQDGGPGTILTIGGTIAVTAAILNKSCWQIAPKQKVLSYRESFLLSQ